jgi:hypothetical protein
MFDVHHGKKRESVMTTNVNIVENFGTTLHTPLAVERKDFFPPSQFFPPLMNFSPSQFFPPLTELTTNKSINHGEYDDLLT